MTLLADVVGAAGAVAATSARTTKIEALAGLLRSLSAGEVAVVVAILSGEPRQGRIGVGWAAVGKVEAAPAAEPSITVAEVDAALDEVARTTGAGSVARRTQVLTDLFARATFEEQDFLRRLLLGDLRQGALEGVMAEAVARAADVPAALTRRAAMLSGDLAETAAIALTEGADGLKQVGLRVGIAVGPMLASSAPTVAEALAITGEASVEWKLDGIRVQAHRDGDDVRLFTRNLNDITDRLPDVVEVVRALPSERLVLDGEAIMLGADERPHMFQDTMSGLGNGGGMVPFFFDILYDGADLIDRPLAERRRRLGDLGLRVPSIITADAEKAQRFLDETVAAGHEGVMVKALGSPYQAGRRGKSWVKVKPTHTLDLVVIGVEWGYGRRTGWLSNLHLGARDGDGFVMVGKTFKGLTDETLRWQTERFLELERERTGNTVYVRPEQVVEIALDGVQVSTRYAGGVALRFARVRRYRPDKAPADADTIEAVRSLLPR